MPWAFKVTEINTLFVTLQIIHVFLLGQDFPSIIYGNNVIRHGKTIILFLIVLIDE